MTKQKLRLVLKYTFGILAASFILEFLDLSQSVHRLQSMLTYQFWGKLGALFLIYLVGAYLLVYFAPKTGSEMTEE